MLRRRTAPSELPIHSAQTNCPDNHWKKSKKAGKAQILRNVYVTLLFVVCAVTGLFYFTRGGVAANDTITANDTRGGYTNDDDKATTSYFGEDTDKECTEWASQGSCRSNRVFVLSKCPKSCHTISGVSVDSLSEHEILEDAMRGFAHFVHDGDEDDEDCRDHEAKCEQWAQEGQCMEDPDEMLKTCPKSCLVCFGKKRTTVTIDFGVEQEVAHSDHQIRTKIRDVIKSTELYMLDEVFEDEDYEEVRRDCRNLDPQCSIYAAMGECHGRTAALAMFQNCAPACHACNALDHYRRCMRRPEDVDILQPGEMNEVFETIIRDYPQYKPTILSQPNPPSSEEKNALSTEENASSELSSSEDDLPRPWIITLENLLSDEECDWFIAKGHEIGFEQASEITDEIKEDGTFGDKLGQGRVSADAWCQDGCEEEPIAKRVMDRIINLTNIPMENSEFLEILKYDVGGHFEDHHDVIETQGQERCGNRILTVYLFLSDVEEGGELIFHELDDKEVKPKKGTAVIWTNVLDDDFTRLQDYTFHEFMPVKQGTTYGAHWWLHPRNLRDAIANDCCN
jgi:prolyl 4-hydroxylase